MANVPLFDAYQTRLYYQFSGLTHVLTMWHKPVDFSLAPGGTPNSYTIYNKLGATAGWETAVNAFLTPYRGLFANTTSFINAELWKLPEGSLDAVFLTAFDPDVVGSAAAANIQSAESIFTSRTQTGRVLKLYAEENNVPAGLPVPWNTVGTGALAVMGTYWLSNGNTVVDREAGYPIGLMRVFPGQNEAIFKRRNRQT